MDSYASCDGTRAGYRTLGSGPALIRLPGGPEPGAAHFPWLDDPAFFTASITSFLTGHDKRHL